MKHTPTPWTIYITKGTSGNIAYEILEQKTNHEQTEGNYKILKAAPKLLEALKLVSASAKLGYVASKGTNRIKNYIIAPDILDTVNTAIKKATGRATRSWINLNQFPEMRLIAPCPLNQKGSMTKSDQIKKQVIGQKIIKFKLRPFWDCNGEKHYDPIIVLENGVWVSFMTTEMFDGSDYGILPIIS